MKVDTISITFLHVRTTNLIDILKNSRTRHPTQRPRRPWERSGCVPRVLRPPREHMCRSKICRALPGTLEGIRKKLWRLAAFDHGSPTGSQKLLRVELERARIILLSHAADMRGTTVLRTARAMMARSVPAAPPVSSTSPSNHMPSYQQKHRF